MEAAKAARDDAWEAHNALLMRTYIPGQDLYVSLPTGEDSKAQAAVYQTNFNWAKKQKEYAAKMDSVIAAVYQKYYGVLQALQKVEAQRLWAELDERKLAVAELRYQVGMESSIGLGRVRAQSASSQAALETAVKELDEAYADLHDLVGLPAGSRPDLIDTVVYSPLLVEDPDNLINTIADNSPSVWIANEVVRLERQTYGMLNSYDLDKVELDQAKVGVDLAREQVRQSTRSLYHKVKSLEESYVALQEEVRVAEDALRVARLSREVGLATEAEVLSAEAVLAQARKAVFDLTCSHELLKMAFYKPWTAGVLLGGTAGGGSGTSGAGQAAGSLG